MSVLKKEYHEHIYFFCLLLFAASLPLSKYLMSISQWLLALNWFLEGSYREKLHRLWKNKAALIFISVFVMHLIGIFWSNDLDYALKDCRIKLPLLILPFIMASSAPVDLKKFRWVVLTHALAVTGGSLYIAWSIYFNDVTDPREAAGFISHIRFSLNVCIAVFFLGYYVFRKDVFSAVQKIPLSAVMLWLVVFLFILNSFTGIAVLLIMAIAVMFYVIITVRKKKVKIIIASLLLLMAVSGVLYSVHIYETYFKKDVIDPSALEYYTKYGNPYTHNFNNTQTENGHYLWLYVCYPELKEAWDKRSRIKFDSTDLRPDALQYTLIRFLTSKNYRKDFDGVNRLSDEEVRAIENGIANVKELTTPGFLRRIENVFWEIDDFRHTRYSKNHSLMQRMELWKTALLIIGEHPLFGVGTGDVAQEFERKLKETGSELQGSSLRSHQQFLAIAIAFGIIGLLWFLFAVFYPAVRNRGFHQYFFFCFFMIALLSMLTEDTLETQAGVSLFAFFYSLLLFAFRKEEEKSERVSKL